MTSRSTSIESRGLGKEFRAIDLGHAWRLVFTSSGIHGKDSVTALKDITLTVPKGEFFGVLGRNGAGKSTLLRVLGHTYAPTSGTFCVLGQLGALYELGIAGQQELTGRQYADQYLQLNGVPKRRRAARIDWIKTFSELEDRFEEPVFTYSAGMAARLYFSTATAEPHDVYLIDEVLSVGDMRFTAKCWRRMRQILGNGRVSGVLVTHDWSAVLKICRRACVLQKGELVYQGIAVDAISHYLGSSIMPSSSSPDARLKVSPAVREMGWTGVCGEDWSGTIPVEICREREVWFRFAFEALVPGAGWEMMLNGMDQRVGKEVGLYEIQLNVPTLPLVPGTYQIHMALIHIDSGGLREIIDSVSWYLGNAILLHVSGDPRVGQVRIPTAVCWAVP